VIGAFIVFSLLINTVGYLFTGSIATRYLQPMLIFPILIVILPLSIHHRINVCEKYYLFIALAATAVAGVFAMPALGGLNDLVNGKYYDKTKHLLAWAGNKNVNGVAHFWLAREMQLYTPDSINVLQVKGDLTPHPWMINLASYKDKHITFIMHDHIIDDGLAIEDDLKTLGLPANIITCSYYTIYDYAGTLGETILNNRIRRGLFTAIADPLLQTAEWVGCELPSQTGHIIGSARVASAPVDHSGYLSYGPYISLKEAGRYLINIKYSANGYGKIPGHWDAGSFHPKEQLLFRSDLTDGQCIIESKEIVIPKRGFDNLEIRVWFNGNGEVKLHSIEIQRK
jgi:hypothetical protein